MKKYIKYLGLVAAAFTAVSCSNFLTEDPKGSLAPETFYQTQNDLNMAVNSLYYNVAMAWKNTNPVIAQCQGDDVTSITGSNKAAYLSADAFEIPSEYKGVNEIWQYQYNIIQAADQIIDYAHQAKVSQAEINIAKGNAYFWRACAYFTLVRLFGPLPLNMHNESDNNNTPLSSVEDVYKLIISDLETADGYDLPASYEGRTYGYVNGNNVWISQQAVKSLLSAVYMNMAGYPLNQTDYYAKAADKAKEVVDGVNNGTYFNKLEDDWKDVFSHGNEFSREQIVFVSYYTVPGVMGDMYDYVSQFGQSHRFAQLNSGWSDFVPERYYWSMYPEGPRKDAIYNPQIYMYYTSPEGDPVCVDWWATTDEKPYDGKNAVVNAYHPMFASFCVNADEDGNPVEAAYDYTKPATNLQSLPQCHRMIRYSEVLLWFAESAARAGLYPDEARAALEQVQARAYAPNVKPDNSDIAEAAYREHGYEVAGYTLALCTRRADEFRMNRLKDAWEYRHGEQNSVLVPKGTLTHSYKRVKDGKKFVYQPYTYTLDYDLIMKEEMNVADTWRGENSIYQIYPPSETEKNPLIVRP